MREPSILERLFAVPALVLVSGAIVPLWRLSSGAAPDGVDGDPAMQVLLSTIYVIALVLLATRGSELFAIIRRARLLLLFLALVAASVFWSDAPALTARRAVALVSTSVFGLYFGARYSVRQQVTLLGIAFGLMAVLSLGAGLALPSYGISDEAYVGAWRGVFVHKNQLGRMMVLTTVIGWLLVQRRGASRIFGALLIAAGVTLIVVAQSQTSLVICAVLILLALLARIGRLERGMPIIAPAAILVVAVATTLIALHDPEAILSALGRDRSLTGRTGLWDLSVEMIRQRPCFGYGYAAFWRGWDGPSAYIWELAGWEVPHSHNGYLDVCLAVGIVPLSILLLGLVASLRQSLMRRVGDTAEDLWPLLYLVFTIASNFTESALAVHNSIFWVLYVGAVTTVAARASARPGVEMVETFA
ncbi:MAG: lipid core-O-antigen ligase-like enyme [bacterium]|nr:lipid core-O-antigen ligase-like enyme [bacterium]